VSWQSSYARSFEKDLLALPDDIRERALFLIGQILQNPFLGKKLKGRPNRYFVRIGRDYRMVYSVYKAQRLIDFEFVGDRKDAYRWFRHE